MGAEKLSSSTEGLVGHVKKHHHIAIHIGVAVFVGAMLFLGSRGTPDNAKVTYTFGYGGGPITVDEVSSADVAAAVAQQGNLLIANNVKNLADSVNAQVEFATTNNTYIAKPQLIATDASSRSDIVRYTVKKGDSVSSIASEFNITSDTIRWANNISGDSVSPGDKLTILPVTGILHTVVSGDTVESIAQLYRSNKEQIIAFNDAELSGLKVGQKIVVPGGVKVEVAATTASFSSPAPGFATGGFSFGAGPVYNDNGYGYGYCTWHAANRRAQIGRPIPSNLGNAISWYNLAASAGLGVGSQPRAGSVLWHNWNNLPTSLGHVAFVEKVNPDGSILVSDMNYPIWNVVTYRTIKPNEFNQYRFIY